MVDNTTISTAAHYLPAVVMVVFTIYAAYWVLGFAKWPNLSWRESLLDRLGTVDLASLGGFRLGGLALVSLVSLYLELLLIRWVSSEIRIFAYFKSLVLIACFLGFGLGCYLTRSRIRLAYTLVPLLALVLIIELPWDALRQLIAALSDLIGLLSDVHVWYSSHFVGSTLVRAAAAGLAVVMVITLFGLVAMTFVPLGQLVGWYLENAKNGVRAYSFNVIASILGIWLYTILCFLWSPPLVWFSIFAVGFVIYLWPQANLRRVAVGSMVVLLGLLSWGTTKHQWWARDFKGSVTMPLPNMRAGAPIKLWSPYQKLSLIPLMLGDDTVRYLVNTNDSWYQQWVDLRPESVAKHPELTADLPVQYHQYNLPYRFYQNPPSVLIAGAGGGNDAAAAIRNGAGHVTAVEIDPLIRAYGERYHFEAPYRSNKVDVVVDDARAFIQGDHHQYDLIVFSILDSHTTSSYYTNIRLDNYVYTIESLQAVRKLLKPDGIFVMSFSGARPWFAGRLHDVVAKAFDKEPVMIQSSSYFFVVGLGDRVERTLAGDSTLRAFVASHSNVVTESAAPTTDDWPYLYQQNRGIPTIVWVLSLGLLAVCWGTFRKLKRSGEPFHWHFFFLGAAFMLLEVQIISKIALLFGTTWVVNSIVITTLLAFILLSNVVVGALPPIPRLVPYVGLFVTLALGFLIPANALFYESVLLRGLVASALYCSPVFFAGLVFISSFRKIGFRAEAFGANLLGSLVGGLLESLSYATGIRGLVIVAAGLYVLSLLTAEPSRLQGALKESGQPS